MQKEQCFSLGKITKLHGYKGAVVLHIDSSTPQYFKNLESVLLEIRQELVPFFVSSRGKVTGKKMVLTFEDVQGDEAAALVGASAYLPLELLPPPEEDDFYDKAIVGYKAMDGVREIGTVEDVVENGPQNLFLVDSPSGSHLIPAVDAFISRIDHKKKNTLS